MRPQTSARHYHYRDDEGHALGISMGGSNSDDIAALKAETSPLPRQHPQGKRPSFTLPRSFSLSAASTSATPYIHAGLKELREMFDLDSPVIMADEENLDALEASVDTRSNRVPTKSSAEPTSTSAASQGCSLATNQTAPGGSSSLRPALVSSCLFWSTVFVWGLKQGEQPGRIHYCPEPVADRCISQCPRSARFRPLLSSIARASGSPTAALCDCPLLYSSRRFFHVPRRPGRRLKGLQGPHSTAGPHRCHSLEYPGRDGRLQGSPCWLSPEPRRFHNGYHRSSCSACRFCSLRAVVARMLHRSMRQSYSPSATAFSDACYVRFAALRSQRFSAADVSTSISHDGCALLSSPYTHGTRQQEISTLSISNPHHQVTSAPSHRFAARDSTWHLP